MIDLAKLDAFKLPFVEKDIFLLGEMQKVKIYAMKQTTSARFSVLDEKNPEDRITALALIVADALCISEEHARKLCDVDFEAANIIANTCGDISKEYNEKIKAEREQAEKNLLQAQETITPRA